MSRKPPRPLPRSNQPACVFCDKKPTTEEHLFSKWTRELVPAQFNSRLQLRTMSINGERVELERRKRAGDLASLVVKAFCDNCNNVWMGKIEESVIPILTPMILGADMHLSRRDRQLIASWCALKTIVGEFINSDTRTIPIEVVKDFMKHKSPPKNWIIWIGKYEGTLLRSYWHSSLDIQATENGLPVQTFTDAPRNTQTSTFHIGNLLVHVFSAHPAVLPYGVPLNINDALIQIFPRWQFNTVPWPPEQSIDDEMSNQLIGTMETIYNAIKGVTFFRTH